MKKVIYNIVKFVDEFYAMYQGFIGIVIAIVGILVAALNPGTTPIRGCVGIVMLLIAVCLITDWFSNN